MFSVLHNKNNVKFVETPFPYLVIDNALPKEYYKILVENFPSNKKIIDKNEYKENYAYRYNAANSLEDTEISYVWRNFVKYHTSYDFVDDFYNFFLSSIEKNYPSSKGKLPSKENTGVRFKQNNYFNLDCQFVINTPNSNESAVIEPHLDNPKEFYAGLLYMREKDDDSTGGNLTTHKFKDQPIFHGKSRTRYENINLIEEIEYKENRLVMFLNTLKSIHGVSKRSKTNYYRKYINIIGEFNFPLFDFSPFLEKNT